MKDSVATAVTKLLQDFLARDLLYVLGGFSIEICFYFLVFGSLPTLPPSPFQGSLLIGSAYVIGYAVQDLLSLTRLVTTSTSVVPGRFVKWLYKRFEGKFWVEPSIVLDRAKRELLYVHVSEQSLSDLRRMIFLKHIGAAMGSSWFLCAVLLFVKFLVSKTGVELSLQKSELLSIAIGLTILSLGLLGLGRVKSEQQKLFMSHLYEEVKKAISTDSANQSHGSSSKKVEDPPPLAIED